MIVFHRTTPAAKEAIMASWLFLSREQGEVCVSNVRDGYAKGYGEAVVTLDVPEDLLILDDEFQTGEVHYRLKGSDIRPEHIIA